MTLGRAEDGGSGIVAFEALTPDIVLLDVMMPDVSGFTVCEQLRASSAGAHVPILMITGNEDVDSVERAYEAGATDFAAKPINYPVLIHRIRYVLRAKIMADSFRESERSLVYAQRIAKLGNFELDLKTDRSRCSGEVGRILGLTSENSELTFRAVMDAIHPADKHYAENTLHRSLRNKDSCQLDYRLVRHDEKQIIVHQETGVVTDDWGNPIRLLGTIQDVTEHRKTEARMHKLAYYDDVTGLPN